MIATDATVGQAEGIIDDTYVLLQLSSQCKQKQLTQFFRFQILQFLVKVDFHRFSHHGGPPLFSL